MSDTASRDPTGSILGGGPPGAEPSRVTVVGVGLLGASVALSLRRRFASVRVIGLIRQPEQRRRAIELGIVDEATDSLAVACRESDVVVIATPVDRIAALVVEAAAVCPDEGLITDVGSTKGTIVEQVEADSRASGKFVAAHPIAGGERGGMEHAAASLFDGRLVVLTPSPETPANRVERAEAFWRATGAATLRMPPRTHDAHLAATSHLPHLVAAAVARAVSPESAALVGTGWLDTTRIASGDPDLWTAIVAENRQAIRHELERFRDDLDDLIRCVDRGDDDALRRWLEEAKQARDAVASPGASS